MRTKVFISAMLFAAAAFVGCNKNDGEQVAGETHTMVVQLPKSINTRVVDDVNAGGAIGATISNVHVFLMNGISVSQYATFTPAEIEAKEKEFENIPSSVTNVIVLANVPAGDVTAVAALGNTNAIKGYAFTAASQQNTVDGIKKLTLLGTGNVIADGDNKKASVKLNSLTARFEIGDVKPGTGIKEVHLRAVYINNYYTTNAKTEIQDNKTGSPVWLDLDAVYTNANPTLSTFPVYSEPTYFNTGVTLGANQCYAFHVFAGENIPHLVLVVSGEYDTDYFDPDLPNSQYFVKYVTFKKFITSGDDELESIEANKIYKIGVGSGNGIEIKPGEITTKPEEEETTLKVGITVENWTTETLTPSV